MKSDYKEPYKAYQGSYLWYAVHRSISSLEAGKDIYINHPEDAGLIVGYLCEKILQANSAWLLQPVPARSPRSAPAAKGKKTPSPAEVA